jgi:hypothetical protein
MATCFRVRPVEGDGKGVGAERFVSLGRVEGGYRLTSWHLSSRKITDWYRRHALAGLDLGSKHLEVL